MPAAGKMTSSLVLLLLEYKVHTLASPLCCADCCPGGCVPSVILSTPKATALVAWRGGLARPPPSRAAASIPPSLSHWPREWIPSLALPALEAAHPSQSVCPPVVASREGEVTWRGISVCRAVGIDGVTPLPEALGERQDRGFIKSITGNLSFDTPCGGPPPSPSHLIVASSLIPGRRRTGEGTPEPQRCWGNQHGQVPALITSPHFSTHNKSPLWLRFPDLPTAPICPYLLLPLWGLAGTRPAPDDLCPAFLARCWEFQGKPEGDKAALAAVTV